MVKEVKIDRLLFLGEQFDVFDHTDETLVHDKMAKFKETGYNSKFITDANEIIAIISTKANEKNRLLKKVSVSSDVYAKMIIADPTENKIYLQWMLNVFSQLLKDDTDASINSAIRFVLEDLPQANTYLGLFENNKRKQKFKDLCRNSYSLTNVKDPTNINQYKTLSQLFDAVDPFIEREPSAIERTMLKYINSGEALMPVKDRKFTLYIPKTVSASSIFNKFANWCTAKNGNGMFKKYTTNYRKPNGKDSELYIIINNDFFKGISDELYQIHFETDQLRDRKNSQNVSIFEKVLAESEALSNFFYEQLIGMAKAKGQSSINNIYLNHLIKFGFTDSLFDLYDIETPIINIIDREVPKIPNVSKFKNVDMFIMVNTNLVEVHPSIGELRNLEILSLGQNRIKKLPSEIGQLKNLLLLNITGNKNIEIPEEIKYLDLSNGGSLHRLCVDKKDIGGENYERLKRLLPSAII